MLGLSPSREISEIYLIIHAIAFRSKMKTIDIYTDGACSGNPGIGGWAALLIYNGHKKEISGYDKDTTNNRMEIFAVIQGLRALKESCIVNLYTDSSYVSDAFNKAWIAAWQKNNWRTASKKEVKNQDLWRALLYETHKHKISFIHVQGHADNEFNNHCDRLAREAIETCRKNNEK